MAAIHLKPTVDQTYEIPCPAHEKGGNYDFQSVMAASMALEKQGDIRSACEMRYQAFQRIFDLIPEKEEIELEWEEANTQAAMMIINSSAIDHFLIGDWEMCAGMLEFLLDLDPEDHMEATIRLAYSYIALEEFDLFDEIINDVSEKHPDKLILSLWSEFRRAGRFIDGDLIRFKRRFTPYYTEFTAASHPVDQAYLSEIEKEKPAREALARETWLQTEHLWQLFPGFIEALKTA